ncbi:DinB family protein [Hugenholtzia roseola]|uniref:DinB family protein n=1 Tax=Hugenholtzia roseola TaxID=1002 RepID=UPI0012B5C5E8|nr:DinB family protein [Hugenholtzia roseola]
MKDTQHNSQKIAIFAALFFDIVFFTLSKNAAMLLQNYLLRLWEYNEWANQTYLTCLVHLEEAGVELPPRLALLNSHVILAQKLWLTRIKGNPDLSIDIWESLPFKALSPISAQNFENWKAHLATADEAELERKVSYLNFEKKPYISSVFEICMQNINHASYHRAQYALLLRQQGIKPPNTDFITHARLISGQPL